MSISKSISCFPKSISCFPSIPNLFRRLVKKQVSNSSCTSSDVQTPTGVSPNNFTRFVKQQDTPKTNSNIHSSKANYSSFLHFFQTIFQSRSFEAKSSFSVHNSFKSPLFETKLYNTSVPAVTAQGTLDLSSTLSLEADFNAEVNTDTDELSAKANVAAVTKAEGPTASASLRIEDVQVNLSTTLFAKAGMEANASIDSLFTEKETSGGFSTHSFVGASAGLENTMQISTKIFSLKFCSHPSVHFGYEHNYGAKFLNSDEQFSFSLSGSLVPHLPIGNFNALKLTVNKPALQDSVESLDISLAGQVKALKTFFENSMKK